MTLSVLVLVIAFGLAAVGPPEARAGQPVESRSWSQPYVQWWWVGFETYRDFHCTREFVIVESWADVQKLANEGLVKSCRERGFFGLMDCRTVADTTP